MIGTLFNRYKSETSGNIAMMTAGVLTMLLIGVGAAVDMSRLHSTAKYLQDATDNAALAAVSNSDLDVAGQERVAAETLQTARRLMVDGVVVLSETVDITEDGSTATVDVTLDVPLVFGGFLGQSTRRVNQVGVATRAGSDKIEPTSIIFVLDASGSMSANLGGSSRIAVLRASIRNAFANFEANPDSEERLRTGVYAYNWGIRDESSVPLDAGWSTVISNVESMQLGNATIPAQALEVAVDEMIAEDDFFAADLRRKVIVYMTDGEVDDHLNMNNRSSIYHPYSGYTGSFTERTIDACARAQAADITVIAVSLGAPQEGRELLQSCADAGTQAESVFINAVNARKFEEALELALPSQEESLVRLVR